MKLRIKGNSIRLRLTKSEVNQLLEKGEVSDQCYIIDRALIYTILIDDSNDKRVSFYNNKIQVSLKKYETLKWGREDEVTIKHILENGFNLLIEKDFKCLIERPEENNDDMFENPKA